MHAEFVLIRGGKTCKHGNDCHKGRNPLNQAVRNGGHQGWLGGGGRGNCEQERACIEVSAGSGG